MWQREIPAIRSPTPADQEGVVEWDEDLLINGRSSLETVVHLGMGIGRGRRLLSDTMTS